MTEDTSFRQWAIVDVMGHQRYVGLVTEEVIAGQGFVRVDVPETSKVKGWSKLIGTSSIYAITPVEEDIARAMAERQHKKPIEPYQLTAQDVAAASARQLDFQDEEYDEAY